jgi:hypothetical protein
MTRMFLLNLKVYGVLSSMQYLQDLFHDMRKVLVAGDIINNTYDTGDHF